MNADSAMAFGNDDRQCNQAILGQCDIEFPPSPNTRTTLNYRLIANCLIKLYFHKKNMPGNICSSGHDLISVLMGFPIVLDSLATACSPRCFPHHGGSDRVTGIFRSMLLLLHTPRASFDTNSADICFTPLFLGNRSQPFNAFIQINRLVPRVRTISPGSSMYCARRTCVLTLGASSAAIR